MSRSGGLHGPNGPLFEIELASIQVWRRETRSIFIVMTTDPLLHIKPTHQHLMHSSTMGLALTVCTNCRNDHRCAMTDHSVRESIREIDDDTWLIGERLLLSRASAADGTWGDENGGGYLLSDAPLPLPKTRPLSDNRDIKLIHDAGDVSAVFRIGEAYCKVRVLDVPDATREHITLAWVHQQTWSFSVPEVLHHAEFDGRYYIILSRIPGFTIDSLWSNLEEHLKQHFVERIVDICAEMTAFSDSSHVAGVDGSTLPERYLCGREVDCSPQNLRRNCEELGMDCSKVVFYHCDLSPTNILVDPVTGFVGIIDWEIAGFVPIEWVKTKVRVCSGMNLSGDNELEWRKRVINRMEDMGFTDVVNKYITWGK
jgi:serine/threonine protein kinase